MVSLLLKILTSLVIIGFVVGMFANVFIALVNSMDWVRRRRTSLTDRMITALAVCRISSLWALIIHWFLTAFNSPLNSSSARITASIVWMVTNHFNTWLVACLSIFYLFKIANFSNFIFLHLKRNANHLVLVILLGTLVLLPSNIVMCFYNQMEVNGHEDNVTSKAKLSYDETLWQTIAFTLATFVPFIMCLISAVLLIYFLSKHLRSTKFHGKQSEDVNTQVYAKVLRTVFSFVVLFAMYSLFTILSGWSYGRSLNPLVVLLSYITDILYLTGHSFVLIWGNNRLKQAFLSVVWQARCRLRD